ncbi:porin family protein [Abyssalbus ytuae]|uniref:PorT family protein n=1 Tax=Abyssalbus ytuae TaxID=2926907 RepID=A0A9E6ZJL6_9FLAO|nr:porin family protein [Abyssalbus ytuae]UOB16784.1 PorT family protein [Abyssalbus ytuae]
MKKAFFLIFTVFICTYQALAQFNEDPVLNLENFDKQPVHWGYFLGFNQYDFKFDYNTNYLGNSTDVLVNKSIGFNVGLIGNLRINSFLDLRFEPGLYYTQRNLFFPDPQLVEERDYLREVKSTYIHFPLLLKVSTKRFGNFKPYLVGGVSTSLNLGSNEKSPDDNSNGTFRMKKSTYYYELGIGIDFYLYYFKFSPSIRGVFAMNDELKPDNDPNSPWTSNINGLYTRGIFINFTFE